MKIAYFLFIVLLIIISLPFQLVIAVTIFITVGLPIFFQQKRVGLRGKTFVLYKFRTMVIDAEKKQQLLSALNEAHGPVFKIYDDPRFTPIGKFLSHTGLDELPQLYNVLCGDMAIFGPRPLPLFEAKKLTALQRGRHRIKPGILSSWILDGYHKRTFTEWMASDLNYIKKKNIWYDSALFVRSLYFMGKLLIWESRRSIKILLLNCCTNK